MGNRGEFLAILSSKNEVIHHPSEAASVRGRVTLDVEFSFRHEDIELNNLNYTIMSSAPDYVLAFVLVALAGLSTTLGASLVLFGRCSKLEDTKLLASSLALSAGVMIYVSFVEIFQKSHQAFEEQGLGLKLAYLAATLCLFGGFILTKMLDMCVRKVSKSGGVEAPCACHERGSSTHSIDNIEAQSSPLGTPKQSMNDSSPLDTDTVQPVLKDTAGLKKTGYLVALALGMHNLPEGLVTFVGTLDDPAVGVSLCIAIAIHNIPEGVCVAMPIFYATGNRRQAFCYAFISGVAEIIGALLGYIFIIATGTAAFGIVFGVVGGMMIYICFSELIPTAMRYDPQNHFVTNCLFLGMAIMALSLVLFK